MRAINVQLTGRNSTERVDEGACLEYSCLGHMSDPSVDGIRM